MTLVILGASTSQFSVFTKRARKTKHSEAVAKEAFDYSDPNQPLSQKKAGVNWWVNELFTFFYMMPHVFLQWLSSMSE